MSNFNNKSITNKGLELLSAAMAGGKLEFTRIVMGSGAYSGDIGLIENLVSQKQSLDIKSITRKGSQVVLSTTLLQSAITEDFYWKEIGVYAKGADGVEVLYMYGSAIDTSFISKDMLNEKMINVGVLVSNAQNITATIDGSLVYLSRADLEAHNNDGAAHSDIRKLIDNLSIEVKNIDLSGVNSHTTSVGESIKTLINSISDSVKTHVTNMKDLIISAIASARDVITSHITSQHTVTKTHVSNERATIINSINAKASGDITGKTMISLPAVAFSSTALNAFTYSNSKGGMLRLAFPNIHSIVRATVTVDGVTFITDAHLSTFCTVTGGVDGYFNYYLDVPFSSIVTVQPTALHSSSGSKSINVIAYVNK